uniref:Uncharacterized protein n=1 Tax=Pundamilia nyererei TaxID=303518 RepID=A0A3B4G0Z5_9CICH
MYNYLSLCVFPVLQLRPTVQRLICYPKLTINVNGCLRLSAFFRRVEGFQEWN